MSPDPNQPITEFHILSVCVMKFNRTEKPGWCA